MNWLDEFLESVQYSTWEVKDFPAGMGEMPKGYQIRNGRCVPVRPDGFIVGNGLTRAAIATRFYNGTLYPTALSHLFGPTYGYLVLREPYERGGGNYISPCPCQDFLLEADGQVITAEDAQYKLARRILGAPITHTFYRHVPLELTTLDFAPVDPLLPAIIRIVKVQNLGSEPVKASVYCYLALGNSRSDAAKFDTTRFEPDLGWLSYGAACSYHSLNYGLPNNLPFALSFCVDRSPTQVGVGDVNNRCWDGILKGSPPRGEYSRSPFDEYLKVDLGTIPSGDSKWFPCLIVTGLNREDLERTLKTIRAQGVANLLNKTYTYWQKWSEKPRFSTSYPRVDHLIDTLMHLEKMYCDEIGGGIVAGMLNYGLGYWIRDGYYQARSFLKLGKYEEVRKNLRTYIDRVARQGVTNCYHLDGTAGDGTYSINYELPSLLILMARDYYAWTDDQETLRGSISFVKKAAEAIRLTEDYLAMASGDETWRIPALSENWAETPDNSFSAALALEFAGQMIGEGKYKTLAQKVREAVDKYCISPEGRYIHYRTKDGSQDERPITNIMTRPLVLGYASVENQIIRKGLEAAWRYNRIGEGIVKHDTLTTGFPGNAPGYMLYCLAEMDSVVAGRFFWDLIDLASASGSYWEFYYTEDPNFSGERLRSWDSAVILEGLLHYLYGVKPLEDGFVVAPHLPEGIQALKLDDFTIRGKRLSLSVEKDGFLIEEKGRRILRANRPLRVEKHGDRLEIRPIGKTPPYLDVPPLILDAAKGRLEVSFSLGDVTLEAGGVLYSQKSCKDKASVIIENRSDQALEVILDGSSFSLKPKGKRSIEISGTELQNELYLLTPDHQVVEKALPGKEYLIRGRAYYENGLPYSGEILVSFSGKDMKVKADSLGYYEFEIHTPSERGEYPLNLSVNERLFDTRISVLEDPMEEIDEVIAQFGKPCCRLLVERNPYAIGMAWEVWRDVLVAKGVDIPVVFHPREAKGFHLICVGDVPLKYERLGDYRGYSTGKTQDGKYVFVLPKSEDMREVQSFLNALRVHWRYPVRDKRVSLLRRGEELKDEIGVEVQADEGLNVYIGSERAREGRLVKPVTSVSSVEKPYLKVYLKAGDGSFFKVMVESNSDISLKAKIKLHFPQTMVYTPSICSLYMNPEDEGLEIERMADGSKVITVTLQPGRPLSDNRVIRMKTYRRVEIPVFSLKPQWYERNVK